MFPTWTWVVGFWLGAAIGSFLNVVIYRLPRGLSIYKPKHSFCPSCNKQLGSGELVPILSWLWQRGRCSCGKNKIGARYMSVELVTGTIFALIWYQQLVLQPHGLYSPLNVIYALGYMFFAGALIAAIYTDLAHYIIPDQINAFMLVTGIAMNIAFAAYGFDRAFIWGIPSSLAGALVGTGVLWGITFLGRVAFGKDAMGHGDIKMVRGIGAVVMPIGVGLSVAIAVVLGSVIGILMVYVRARRDSAAAKPVESAKPVDAVKSVETAKAAEPGAGEHLTQKELVSDEPPYEPESIGSLLWCGLGYFLAIDAIGLAIPKLYELWFKENPYSTEGFEEDPVVDSTMIPFGPYLAAGALGVVLLGPQLDMAVKAYLKYNGLD